jgi:hypothetical protein
VTSLAVKLFGEPPGEDAPDAAKLRWVRRFYLRPLPLVLVVYAMLALWATSAVVLVLAAVGALVWLQGFISLSLRIRRVGTPPTEPENLRG